MGTEWEGEQGYWLDRGNRPKKTGETVDRRQNNGSVKAVSPRHCPATCALCNCSFNCCAGQSLRQCPLHRCWWTTWTTRSKRRPTCSAQLHLPTHDLFWAKVRAQLHLPPLRSLDLLISPGTLGHAVSPLSFMLLARLRPLYTLFHWWILLGATVLPGGFGVWPAYIFSLQKVVDGFLANILASV